MLLRPRQKELVNRAVEALHRHGNTLAVAPTGAGKTIMLSATIGEMFNISPLKSCVLAHRDELTAQNVTKFSLVNPHLSTSIVDASSKSWQGNTTFAMAQTLSRKGNLATMPRLDLLVIDEAHHARSESYLRIISCAKALNPSLKVLGMTATPNRGDKRGLHPVFSNICDQITVEELIASGHLVEPKMFVMDVGIQKTLQEVRKVGGDYVAEEVAFIMDTYPINQAVVAHWQEKAGDRQTVVFCSTVDHASHVAQAFKDAGIFAVLIHGDMSDTTRKQTLKVYTTGAAQVIINVGVLTEGWDDPLTSCVVLLRQSSYKSTFIQMIGRGLRPVNPEEHPAVVKNDCIVLDFGTATLTHKTIEQCIKLDDVPLGAIPVKNCPRCGAEMPVGTPECPECDYIFGEKEKMPLKYDEFEMKEFDILTRPYFIWIDIDGKQRSFMASGLNAWGGVFFRNNQWYAVGALKKQPARVLVVGEEAVCLAAANDWMNVHESDETARKVKGWVSIPATYKQRQYLPEHQNDSGLSCYKASVLMTLKFNTNHIRNALYKGGVHG